MRRTALFTLVIVVSIVAHLFARQTVKKKATTNTSVKSRSDSTAVLDTPVFFVFPEFYSFWPVDKNDTTLKYQCYDMQNDLLNADTLHNVDEVKFIELVKVYTDYTHTYVDNDGKPQPMPVLSKISRYDRSGIDKWVKQEFATKEYSYFKEDRSDIVRADTTSGLNPLTGNKQLTIRKYYKVEPTNP